MNEDQLFVLRLATRSPLPTPLHLSYAAPVRTAPQQPLGLIRGIVARIGAAFIHGLIRLFGRVVDRSSAAWLAGPIGGAYIGDRPYEEMAAREDLQLVRRAASGGLVADMAALDGAEFAAERLRPEVRSFYEQTTGLSDGCVVGDFFPRKHRAVAVGDDDQPQGQSTQLSVARVVDREGDG
jgi:hypothetical protein